MPSESSFTMERRGELILGNSQLSLALLLTTTKHVVSVISFRK